MANSTMLDQVCPGMKVRTSDGKRLGIVRQVHQREAEVYGEVLLRASIWKPMQALVLKHVYLPGTTVSDVAGKHVAIALDAKTAQACTWRPAWLQPFEHKAVFDAGSGSS